MSSGIIGGFIIPSWPCNVDDFIDQHSTRFGANMYHHLLAASLGDAAPTLGRVYSRLTRLHHPGSAAGVTSVINGIIRQAKLGTFGVLGDQVS